jgi:hypothetical protein
MLKPLQHRPLLSLRLTLGITSPLAPTETLLIASQPVLNL